jgi:hypothetical protein
MLDRALRRAGILVVVAAAASCGSVDLSQALKVVDTFGGYYDAGVQSYDFKDTRGPVPVNQIKPSLTFRLENTSDQPISSIQILASFWKAGVEGEADSVLVNAITGDALDPGEKSEPLTVRTNINYNVEGPRTSLFSDERFVEMSVRLFAKRSGRLYRLGEYTLDRVILPHAGREAPR